MLLDGAIDVSKLDPTNAVLIIVVVAMVKIVEVLLAKQFERKDPAVTAAAFDPIRNITEKAAVAAEKAETAAAAAAEAIQRHHDKMGQRFDSVETQLTASHNILIKLDERSQHR